MLVLVLGLYRGTQPQGEGGVFDLDLVKWQSRPGLEERSALCKHTRQAELGLAFCKRRSALDQLIPQSGRLGCVSEPVRQLTSASDLSQ
jgi:hypothetical protein